MHFSRISIFSFCRRRRNTDRRYTVRLSAQHYAVPYRRILYGISLPDGLCTCLYRRTDRDTDSDFCAFYARFFKRITDRTVKGRRITNTGYIKALRNMKLRRAFKVSMVLSYSRLSLSSATSTARVTAASKPSACKEDTPSMVVPPGEQTRSTSSHGCVPLSKICFALP